ncbi:DSD1 family PLP-dependent enzyme [Marinimicrococcus flavescens]|uniref:DSD1 family PLP-dependent enzyme n=1 Tax=Marinimicrococcus flavescens TaxID=3031815 RepID=A0AAP4D6E4_9PROT|nr:DSD1 family PLP-dependent enzyme [Marinimicrococcus flavescens]
MRPESDAWNRALTGEPDGLSRIDTPSLVLDLDAFEANVATMARLARERGIGLRPHAKTHKCASIARRQLQAGAVGLCCAKLGEAEALAAEGIEPLLITAPVSAESKIARLIALNARVRGLAVVVEEPENVKALGEAAAAAGQTLDVLIVNDVGSHRFGVPTVEAAVELGRLIAEQPALRLGGIQGYAGRIQHITGYEERRLLSRSAAAHLGAVRDALREAGLPCPVVTGAGTGTHDFDHEGGVFTDLQVGSYIFMDADYDAVALTPDGSRRFSNALFVLTRVTSCQHDGFATTDAGSKCFALDGPPPRIARGAPQASRYGMFGDQFGKVELPDGGRLPVGTLLTVVPSHCDPTVNLYDAIVCVRGGKVEAIWPIEGRGRTD